MTTKLIPHSAFMKRAIELALKGIPHVRDGALVGAVLVRDDTIIGEAFYEEWGGPHAERILLKKFEGTLTSRDILYVSLEPCTMMPQKKTPPCDALLVSTGVRHVVYGAQDPNPHVQGRGIATLLNAGIEVVGPFMSEESLAINGRFLESLKKNS